MFNITKSDIQRATVSGLGALAVSATCLFAAAAPVKAATPVSASAWTQQVQRQIVDLPQPRNAAVAPSQLATAELAAHFTADGDFAGATLAQSSGDRAVDREAVRVADAIRYPRLPFAMRGAPSVVTLRLFFGNAALGVEAPASSPSVAVTAARDSGIQVAAR